jgi:hypothetical protein
VEKTVKFLIRLVDFQSFSSAIREFAQLSLQQVSNVFSII